MQRPSLQSLCALGAPLAISDHHERGGEGALDLARQVIAHADDGAERFTPLYAWSDPVEAKIKAVATAMYGARSVSYTKSAKRDLKEIERLGYAGLPICMAKIPGSLSDDAKLRGRPRDFDIAAGAFYCRLRRDPGAEASGFTLRAIVQAGSLHHHYGATTCR